MTVADLERQILDAPHSPSPPTSQPTSQAPFPTMMGQSLVPPPGMPMNPSPNHYGHPSRMPPMMMT